MLKSWSRLFILTIGMPLFLGMLTACGGASGNSNGSNNAPAGSTLIRIATDYPVSGKDASAGKAAENGAHLAVDQANQNNFLPGYTFEFVPRDDVGPQNIHDPATGRKNVVDLVNDALVAGIVGPLNTNVAQTELPVAKQAPIALISPSTTDDCLTQTTPASVCDGTNNKLSTYRPTDKVTFFRIATLDQYQGLALADFSFKIQGYKKAFLVDDTGTYGVSLASAFNAAWLKSGGSVLGQQSIPITSNSLPRLLTTIAATNPDVIFFGGNDSTASLMRQQMMQVPTLKSIPLVGGNALQTSAFAQAIQPLGGGPVFTSQAFIDASDASKLDSARDFIPRYNAVYGATTLSAYSGGSYDCAMILMQAIKAVIQKGVQTPKDSTDAAQALVFRQAIIDTIQHIDYNGVTGHQTFDQSGDTTNHSLTIHTLSDDINERDGWSIAAIIKVP
jgi:branched-chain amino acid transport system substrate-binding protein